MQRVNRKKNSKHLHKRFKLKIRFVLSFILFSIPILAQKLQLNDLEYFEKQGVNIFVFSNQYNGMFYDEKTAGIELIHHGVRTATGGAVRLQNTPEQWDLIPEVVERKVNPTENSIEVSLRYKEYDFYSKIKVMSLGNGVSINVFLDQPIPKKLEGKAGFNLEFLPVSYFEKSYLVDGKPNIFPLYPSGNTLIEPLSQKIPQFAGHTTFDDRGRGEFIVPEPLAKGKTLVLAPEDPERCVKIQSEDTLMLFDGRNLAQNGWFVVRSLFPAKKTGKVLTWYLEPNAIPNWKRKPVFEFSQVGYLPEQKKVAVIELDKNDAPFKTASLFKVKENGQIIEKLNRNIETWGRYLRYNYIKFDFSSVKEPGLYFIQYGDQKTNTFPIASDVYDNIWHPTSDIWFPVQMDHMMVNEAYRVWHGVPFLDDALQAPLHHQHFDGYKMGDTTDTKYKSLERIPGLAVGGWFDAGDFDIQTASHCDAVLSLVNEWENFNPKRDETYIDYKTRYVDIHRPDGKPDILQQIEHGTLNMVAQVKNIGHPVRGIVVPNLHQYHHLGDASTETDNLPYNPSLAPYQTDGKSSGAMDDRWAFTTRDPSLDYYTAAALAAASRVLKGFNDTLSVQSLECAEKLWNENEHIIKNDTSALQTVFKENMQIVAALQLYITTKNDQYIEQFKKLIWSTLDQPSMLGLATALQSFPYLDQNDRNKLKEYVVRYKQTCDNWNTQNPYGVPMMARGWGGNSNIINWATTNYYVHRFYPELMNSEYVLKGMNYIFGCHPYSNVSFVSAVGTHSKRITYGNNRADFSFIAGGVVPGLLLLKPDFPENKEDWPFLWGENEVTVGICADYIFLSTAVQQLIKDE